MSNAIETIRTTDNAALIGAAVIGISGHIGYVAAVHDRPAGSFSLGTGRMEAIRRELEIVFPEPAHISTTPDTIAARLGVQAGPARYEPEEFCGTCAPFYALQIGQPCPEPLRDFDDAEWSLLSGDDLDPKTGMEV